MHARAKAQGSISYLSSIHLAKKYAATNGGTTYKIW